MDVFQGDFVAGRCFFTVGDSRGLAAEPQLTFIMRLQYLRQLYLEKETCALSVVGVDDPRLIPNSSHNFETPRCNLSAQKHLCRPAHLKF